MATPTIFQRAHAWLGDNALTELSLVGEPDFTIEAGVQRISAHGFAAICVKVQHDQSEINVGAIDIIKQRRDALGIPASRMLVGGWAQLNSGEAGGRSDAEKSNGLIAREHADFFVSACEDHYKGAPGTADHQLLIDYVQRSVRVQPFQDLMMIKGGWGFCYLPNEPAGEGHAWGAVRDAKGRGVAQCYPNQFPNEPSQWPADANKLASDSGFSAFPRSYNHPLLGLYPFDGRKVTGEMYCNDLFHSKTDKYFTYGYAVYLAHHLTSDDWIAFGKCNKVAGTVSANTLAWY
jgi:hypothetical protein